MTQVLLRCLIILKGETALMLAARWGYLEVCRLLLDRGSDPLMKDDHFVSVYISSPQSDHTPLYTESSQNHVVNQTNGRRVNKY